MNKNILYTTVLALAVVMASTGCKHRPNRVTPLPGEYAPAVVGPGPGNTIQGNNGMDTGNGVVAEPTAYNPDNYNQDRSALAAYTIHFAYDSAVIRGSDQASLQAVAQALQADSRANLLIEGNCDERGTEEYNRSLGERRADAAREALVGMGIDANRIHTISYGKDKPVDPGHTAAAWTQNRRDDFVLLHPKM